MTSFSTKFSNTDDDAKMIGAPTRLVLKSFLTKVKKAKDEGAADKFVDIEPLCQETVSTIEGNLLG